MKRFLIPLLLLLTGASPIFAQQKEGWEPNNHQIKLISAEGKESSLEVDAGFRYAEFQNEERNYRFYYNRNISKIKQIRIMDEKSKLQIARGRGDWFWGNARLEFVDGEILKIKRQQNPNGYTIIGPYGPVFMIQNQKIEAVKTYNEKDLLTQAFFVFDRIKSTQKPPQDIVMIYSSYNSNW